MTLLSPHHKRLPESKRYSSIFLSDFFIHFLSFCCSLLADMLFRIPFQGSATSRVLIHESLEQKLVDRLLERVRTPVSFTSHVAAQVLHVLPNSLEYHFSSQMSRETCIDIMNLNHHYAHYSHDIFFLI